MQTAHIKLTWEHSQIPKPKWLCSNDGLRHGKSAHWASNPIYNLAILPHVLALTHSNKEASKDVFSTFDWNQNKISAYPTLRPTIETSKFLPDIPPEPQQEETLGYVEEDFMPLRHKESDPQFPGAFELDPRLTSPAAAATVDPAEEVEVTEASFVEHNKENPPEAEEEREKLPAEENLPPAVPDKQAEPTPEPVADYLEEKRKPRRPRNPASAGFGSFLDNIIDLQAAGQFNPIVVQPVEQSSAPVSLPPDPPYIDITPPTPAPDQSFTRRNPLPTPAQSPPPTPRSIFGVDLGTASRIAELARRRRMEASGELQHPRAQSEQSRNPAASSASSTFPANGLPTPDADEFGHRKGRTDVHSSSSKRQHESPSIDPAHGRRHHPVKLTRQQSDEQQSPRTPESLPSSPSLLIPSDCLIMTSMTPWTVF
ncbi:hypothetical protein BJ165DRAFT_1404261 [Panaeolus papilionaceus]|nr:hypothetical protein BJ165DRAFT_1404261 [Panaeolus papilionaceus]